MKFPVKKSHILAFALAFLVVFGAGVYATRLNVSELVHFWVTFPNRRARPIVLQASQRGFLKQIFDPWHEGLSTHWIVNNDTMPHRVKMELVNVTIPVQWEVHAGVPYDEETRTFTEPLQPKASIPALGIDWIFYFPENVRERPVWYDGGLKIMDADTGETLLLQPIKIVRG